VADIPVVPRFADGAWLIYTVEGQEKETQLPLTGFRVEYALL
jgi:hypothetical protein